MRYFLTKEAALKHLEKPSVYHIKRDELYELDSDSFEFLKKCSSTGGVSDVRKFTNYCLKEAILTKKKVLIKRPSLTKSPEPSLRYLELQITDKCNLRCKHCYIPDKPTSPLSPPCQGGDGGGQRRLNKGNELSVIQIKNILTEFEEMQGLRVLITGGEPLLHSRFKEVNAMLPDFFLRKILFTNGLLLNKKRLEELNVHELQVSIDGMEKAHDSLRGKGRFKKTMKNILLAMECGFEVSVSTMVHPGNLDDFDKMDNLFKGLGIKEWTVDVPCITGRLTANAEFQISPEESGKYLRYGYGTGFHGGEKGFGCGLHLMSVMADGKIAKCTFYSDRPAGSVEDGLSACWKNIMPVRLNKLKCRCRHIESCRGGCRYRAELLGNPFGKDLYRCVFYSMLK